MKLNLKKRFKKKEKEQALWAKVTKHNDAPMGDLEEIPTTIQQTKIPFKDIEEKPFQRQKVYRIGYLRNLKRAVAAILLLFNFIFFLGSTTVLWGFLLFGANSFILCDYIWRTKHVKVETDW